MAPCLPLCVSIDSKKDSPEYFRIDFPLAAPSPHPHRKQTDLFTRISGKLGSKQVPELGKGLGICKGSFRHNPNYVFTLISQEKILRLFEAHETAPFCFNSATRLFGRHTLIAEGYCAHLEENRIPIVDFAMKNVGKKYLDESQDSKYCYYHDPRIAEEMVGKDAEAKSEDIKQDVSELRRNAESHL